MSNFLNLPSAVDLSYIKLDGKDADKTPLIIYHGIFSNKENWTKIGEEISEKTGRSVYVFDLRSHGSSPWPDTFTLLALVSDMNQFLEKHKIKNCILLGHSLGGLAFSRFASLFQDLVEKLILVDINPIIQQSSDNQASTEIKNYCLFMKKCIDELRSEKLDLENAKKKLEQMLKGFFKDGLNKNQFLNRLTIRNGQIDWKFDIEILTKFLEELKNLEDIELSYTKPVLEIYGGKSNIFAKEYEKSILEIFPNSKFECIENADHSPHHTAPNELVKIIVSYLNS